MKSSDKVIVVTETFSAAAAEIWHAITDPSEMRGWFFDTIPDFKPVIGFQTRFDIRSDERLFTHVWRVDEVEAEKKIRYNWRFEGYQGSSDSLFELSSRGDHTDLRLSCIILEDFSDGIPEFTRESCIQGWHYFIKQRLKAYIDGGNF